MARKNTRNTKGRIISAAWKLFYEQGYDETTIEDIVFESQTSKGSFYHYFESKDSLLGTLAYLFDEKYEQLEPLLDSNLNAIDQMIWLNHELFAMIENSISIELLTRLLSTQLLAKGEKHLLDRSRTYFRLLRKIILRGIENGAFREGTTVNQMLKAYAMWERALLYDWCLTGGDYSLAEYSDTVTPIFLNSYRSSK